MGVHLPDAAQKGTVELMSRKHTVYISGPMTGRPQSNYPAFHDAEARLRARGHDVINPAVTGEADTKHMERVDWHDYMASALLRIRHATAICFLPGHEESFGARIEELVGQKMGLETVEL